VKGTARFKVHKENWKTCFGRQYGWVGFVVFVHFANSFAERICFG